MGIRLNSDDSVVDLALVDETMTLLTVCENGYGKRSTFDKYRITRRNGKGVINIKVSDKTKNVVTTVAVNSKDSIIITTAKGIVIRTRRGDHLIGPDNRVLIPAARILGVHKIVELKNDEYMRKPISPVFHGRDIFAPAAAP